MKVFSILLLALLLNMSGYATDGKKEGKGEGSSKTTVLKGKVLDSSNHESLVGAQVKILELDLVAYCDFDGGFEFEDIPAGEYHIQISMVSYHEAVVLEKSTLLGTSDTAKVFKLENK